MRKNGRTGTEKKLLHRMMREQYLSGALLVWISILTGECPSEETVSVL